MELQGRVLHQKRKIMGKRGDLLQSFSPAMGCFVLARSMRLKLHPEHMGSALVLDVNASSRAAMSGSPSFRLPPEKTGLPKSSVLGFSFPLALFFLLFYSLLCHSKILHVGLLRSAALHYCCDTMTQTQSWP